MCGIVGFTGTQNAAPVLLDGLSKLEYRGYDSAGIAVVQGNQIAISKVTGRIQNLREKTDDGRLVPGTTGIGHTRWATHGAPNDINAHPHASNDGKFAVVHNGIIENYMELREELLRKGYRFESETDTEVIVHLIEMYYAGDFRKAVMKASSRLVGSYALGIVCTDAPDTVLAVREASPLILGVGIGENFFASDVTALVAHTRNVIYLEDGELAELTPDSIQVYDCSGHPITKKASRITWDIQAAEKGGYDHFMLKEIMEQPRAVEATITPRIRNGEIVLDDLNIDLSQIHKIVITACGSAYYAGCAGKYTIEKLCRIPVTTELASELRYADPLIDGHTLLIVLSQSGETADTIAAMKECQRRGAKALAIVNVVGSTIAKIADYTLYTWAGPEIAVATTKGYTTQLAVLYLFALRLAYARGQLTEEKTKYYTAQLLHAPEVIKPRLADCEQIKYLASRYVNTQSCFFIGRGFDYALSLEGSLKLKEISYVHSDAYAAGELKHGTISLITDGVPVIALATQKNVYEKTISNAKETRSRGARVLLFTTKDAEVPEGVATEVIRLDEYDDILMPLQLIVPLQLFAYYMAVLRGCDVDKPRNLAKSVTVE